MARRVQGVIPSFLDVFLNPANVSVWAIRHDIHVDFRRVREVPVHEDWMVLRDADRRLHEVSELLLAMHDLHPSTAEDIGRADEDRISNASGDIPDVVEAVSGGGLGLPNPEAADHRRELPTVLREVDRCGGGDEDPGPGSPRRERPCEWDREVNRGLPAELKDDPVGSLFLDDIEDVLEQEGLEVETRRDVEVRRDRLRVVVRDDRGHAGFAQGQDSLDAAIVELDPLTDSNRSAAHDEDLAPLQPRGLVARLIGRVEVRSPRLEFPPTCVDHLVGDARSRPADRLFGRPRQTRDGLVGEAQALRFREEAATPSRTAEARLQVNEMPNLLDDEGIPSRQYFDFFERNALPNGLGDREQPLVRRLLEFANNLVVRPWARLQADSIDFERPDRLQEGFLE